MCLAIVLFAVCIKTILRIGLANQCRFVELSNYD